MNMPALVVLFAASSVATQQRTIEPKDVQVFNRSVSALSDGTRKGVRLNEQPGEGVAYLKGIEFSNGTIEFDVRGKDVQGQSFVGVGFHGLKNTTYDAIYLRPFNFRTEDPARHSRAGPQSLVPCARRRRESQSERLRRRRETAQSGGHPAERPHEGIGRPVGGERLRRGFR